MKKLRWLLAAAPALVLFAALGVFAQQGEPPLVPPGQLRAAIATQERYTPGIMLLSNVVGTAVTAGPGGRGAIVVYASSSDVSGIPASLDSFPVILEVTGEIVALQGQSQGQGQGQGGGRGNSGGGGGGETEDPPADPKARLDRPVPIGVSTGHPLITAGTIGARVFKVGDESLVFALSNNHVYANQNAATIGDDVIQPGTFDGGLPADYIGNLIDYETIYFDGTPNTMDAAIASTTAALLANATPSDGYGTPAAGTVEASINLSVIKYGRTTSQTKGRVKAINGAFDIGYGNNRTAYFVNQIVIGGGGFSAGGDSGSLIVVQKGSDALKAVGLLFAGGGGITIANPIEAVLIRFGVAIDGS